MWFIESAAESLAPGLQTNNLCSRSLPRDDNLGTTCKQLQSDKDKMQ